jgi:D-3-phosphoglycerate dehydrogenase
MVEGSKRVFYVNNVAHDIFIETLGKRTDVRLDKLTNESSDEAAAPVLAGAHVYQIGSSRQELATHFFADRNLLRRAQSLLIVSANGAGYDTVNIEECTDAGVLVVNQTGGNKEAVAEHVLGMMLLLSKRIGEADRAMRREAKLRRHDFIGNDVHGKTVGIVGLGNVGGRVAELCRGLMSMNVLAYDPYLSGEVIAARGAEKVELDELLRRADFVSINCPLTKETRGMIGAREFALMRPHAYFVTTARGFIHDEEALTRALTEKRIAGAGLDVWMEEPPPRDHPLLKLDNVIASPHTAGVTHEARLNMGQIAAEQVLAALDGEKPPRIVNPAVWPLYVKRFESIFGAKPKG